MACCLLLPLYGFAEVKKTTNGINADFDDVTLEEALTEISQVLNIEIKATGDLSEKVTVGYTDTSVEKVLNALLDDYNAMYFRNDVSGVIERVRIFSGKGVVLAPKPEENKAEGEKVPPVPPEQLAEYRDGAFFMPVKINGATMSYLVDTGATMLTVRKQDAFIMSLPVGEEIEINTANGKIKGNITTIDNFEMAGLQLQSVDAVIIDDRSLSVGLVGQNILRHYQVIQHKDMMRLIPSAQVQPQSNNTGNKANQPQAQQPSANSAPQQQTAPQNTPTQPLKIEGNIDAGGGVSPDGTSTEATTQ